MDTVTVRELLGNYKLGDNINVTVISGCGTNYAQNEQYLITQHVLDVIEDVQRIDPAVVVHIVPMDSSRLSYGDIENLTDKHKLTSNIVLIANPTHVVVEKCGKGRKYVGMMIDILH